MKKTKHYKPSAELKTVVIQFRVTAAQYRVFKRAAKKSGYALSIWLRNIALDHHDSRYLDTTK